MRSRGKANFSDLPENISIEIINDIQGVQELKAEWLGLEAHTKDGFTYFQTYDWCEQWCKVYANDTGDSDRRQLFIVAIRNNGKLASIWPLVIERRSRIVKVLRFLGEPLIQYGNILIDLDLLSAADASECWQEIKRQANCDAIVLDRFVNGSPLCRLFDQSQCYQSNDINTSLIDIRQFQNSESFVASQSRATRKSRNRMRRKLEALGEVDFQVIGGNDPQFTELLKIAMQMKIDWLNSSGRSTTSMLDIRTLQLLSTLQPGSIEASGVIAMNYTLEGKPIAIEIGFCHKLQYYSFIGAFDWEMRNYSPGKLQLEQAIIWAIENKFEVFDFLGNPSEYKDSMTNNHISMFGYSTGKSVLGFIYANYWKPQIRPAIKAMFSWMPVFVRQKIVGLSQQITSNQ